MGIMHLPRRVGVGLVVLTLVAMGAGFGCAHHAPPVPSAPMTPQGSASMSHMEDNSRPQDVAPPASDDSQSTANIVARKVQDFTKALAAQGAGEAAGAGGAVDPRLAAASLDPDALRLSPAPPDGSSSQAAQNPPAAVASATIQANRAQVIPAAQPADSQNPMQAADDAKANSVPNLTASNDAAAPDPFTSKLEQRVHDDPQDVSAQLDWQLFQFVHDEPVPQLPALAPLNAEDRELLSAVLDALSNFNNAVRADPNLLLSHKVRPFLDLADRLRNQAELVIPTIELCTRVNGFGVYDPIKPARFPAGKEAKVILYCEVENFASQLNATKQWETRLSQDVVLYTEQNGLEVWRDKTANKEVVDDSRNRRHDFFLAKVIDLPANLTIGRYLLKVSVVDDQVKRVAENTIPIEIVAE
jgi:hypothetical protein